MNIEKHKKEDYPYIFRQNPFYVFYLSSFHIISIFFGLYLVFIEKVFYFFGLIILLFSFLFTKGIENTLKNKPVIKLNSKGIWTKKLDFISWSEIKDITFYPSNTLYDIIFYDDEYPNLLNIYLKNNTEKTSINIKGLEKKKILKQLVNHFLDQENFGKQIIKNSNWDRFV